MRENSKYMLEGLAECKNMTYKYKHIDAGCVIQNPMLVI
jgi:hypothetical protein